MRIMFLDSIDAQTWGGMEEWIRLNAQGLAARGHTVAVAGREQSLFLERLAKNCAGVETLPMAIGGDFHPLTISHLKRELEQRKIDVLLVNFTKDIRLGGLAARFDGDTRVVWSVGLDITKDSWSHRWLTPRLIDSVIVPSNALKQQITALGYIEPELVSVVPIGIESRPSENRDEARARLLKRYSVPQNNMIAVTAGRFVDQKGHAYLIDAVTSCADQTSDITFLLLGDGPLRSKLESQISDAGVRDRFVFAGMVEDVASVLAGCDLMVHPSVEEPYGIALVEGMRASLPIVATDVGGIPEVVDASCAVLVPPRSSADLAGALLELKNDPVRRQALGTGGRRRFEQHLTVERMIDELENCLQQVGRSERNHGSSKTA